MSVFLLTYRVASLKKNVPLIMLGESTGSDGKVWYKVEYNGKTAFVRSDLVEEITESEAGALTEKPASKTSGSAGKSSAPAVKSNSGGTVYWVSGGAVYHASRSCRSLAKSKNIKSGTKAQSGKSRGCKNCVK